MKPARSNATREMPAAFARSAIAGAREAVRHGVLNSGGRDQHRRATRIEHLRVNVTRRAMNGETWLTQLANLRSGSHGTALTPLFFGDLHCSILVPRDYFFLPSLRVICSPE
jgi:hypothetical protein